MHTKKKWVTTNTQPECLNNKFEPNSFFVLLIAVVRFILMRGEWEKSQKYVYKDRKSKCVLLLSWFFRCGCRFSVCQDICENCACFVVLHSRTHSLWTKWKNVYFISIQENRAIIILYSVRLSSYKSINWIPH